MVKVIKRCRAVLDIRDIWPDALVIPNAIKFSLFKWYCNFYLKLSLNKFDPFVHISPSFVKWLHRYAPKTESKFIPLGFDASRWKSTTFQNKMIEGKQIRLVCVGLLQYQIDVMPVLKAMKNRNQFHFTIVGDDGAGERYNEVISYINEHQMENVTIIGTVPPNVMADYLDNQDIGVIPMISDSIPNKVFDYIGAFLPILALGDFDTARFVIDNGIGLSVPFNGP